MAGDQILVRLDVVQSSEQRSQHVDGLRSRLDVNHWTVQPVDQDERTAERFSAGVLGKQSGRWVVNFLQGQVGSDFRPHRSPGGISRVQTECNVVDAGARYPEHPAFPSISDFVDFGNSGREDPRVFESAFNISRLHGE